MFQRVRFLLALSMWSRGDLYLLHGREYLGNRNAVISGPHFHRRCRCQNQFIFIHVHVGINYGNNYGAVLANDSVVDPASMRSIPPTISIYRHIKGDG